MVQNPVLIICLRELKENDRSKGGRAFQRRGNLSRNGWWNQGLHWLRVSLLAVLERVFLLIEFLILSCFIYFILFILFLMFMRKSNLWNKKVAAGYSRNTTWKPRSHSPIPRQVTFSIVGFLFCILNSFI